MYHTEGELALSIRDRSRVPNTTTSQAATKDSRISDGSCKAKSYKSALYLPGRQAALKSLF
jgi:hypothetical protein